MKGAAPRRASRPRAVALAVVVSVVPGFAAVAGAQPNPSIAGNWALVEESADNEDRRAGGLGPTGLIIEVTDEEVVVRSDTGMNRDIETYDFMPGGAEHSIPGPLSWDTKAVSAWQDGKLVVDITRTIESPAGPFSIKMQDEYSVDGDVLTLARSQRGKTWFSAFHRASAGEDRKQ